MTRSSTRPLRVVGTVIAAVAALALAGVLASGWLGRSEQQQTRTPTASSRFSAEPPLVGARPATSPATETLRRWDSRRASAYARSDLAALRDLYVAGSSAGSADVRVLRSYARRGLRVAGLRMQLLAVDVLEQAPGDRLLRVTDRVHQAVVARPDGSQLALPRDEASTRVLRLRRTAAGWKVAAVSR